MSSMTVIENGTLVAAKSWAEIQAVAAQTKEISSRYGGTCIRPGGQNERGAKQTWDQYSSEPNPRVVYFSKYTAAGEPIGYIRFLRADRSSQRQDQKWVVDFVRPSLYLIVLEAASQMEGRVLVRDFSAASDKALTVDWIRCKDDTIGEVLKLYPYHAISSGKTNIDWLIVPNGCEE